jgi:two-component system chemotaxis response regulator CheB
MKPPLLIVIGGSAGSLHAILQLLPALDTNLGAAIIIVLHRQSHYDSVLTELLGVKTTLEVKEAEEKEPVLPGVIYIAPADYHLLLESDYTFSLDYSEKVNFSRPSIDVTFSAAASVYGKNLAALLLSGANADGTEGLQSVKAMGGITAVHNPVNAEVDFMPRQAMNQVTVDHVLEIAEMADFINRFASGVTQ